MNPHTRLGAAFLKSHAAAAARILEDFPAEHVARHLSAQNVGAAAQVLERFAPAFAAACLAALEPAAAARLFSPLNADYQVMLLRQLDRERRESLLGMLEPGQATPLRRRLPYAEGSAGALMEAPLASVPEELSVRNALKRIKRLRQGMKFYIYVTNTQGRLSGVLTLHELLTAPPGRTVAQVMRREVIRLSPLQPLRSVINNPYWQEYHALPVTDEDNLLLGVIRQKRLRRFQEQSVQDGTLSGGLGALITIGELFTTTVGHLLAALIAAGSAPGREDRRG
jgi:magnesium transporter